MSRRSGGAPQRPESWEERLALGIPDGPAIHASGIPNVGDAIADTEEAL